MKKHSANRPRSFEPADDPRPTRQALEWTLRPLKEELASL
jgi:hypothetical protein